MSEETSSSAEIQSILIPREKRGPKCLPALCSVLNAGADREIVQAESLSAAVEIAMERHDLVKHRKGHRWEVLGCYAGCEVPCDLKSKLTFCGEIKLKDNTTRIHGSK